MSFINLAQEIKYKLEATGEGLEKTKCILSAFSAVGHTPLTKRGGAYCDLLVSNEVTVTSREEAQGLADKLLKETPHAVEVWFNMPEYWNQNLRSGYGNRRG